MPEITESGPACPPEETRMFQRPPAINAEISHLLSQGTVSDLFTEKGKFLRMMFTESEVESAMYMPMPECPGYNGVDCDYCRGLSRFSNCANCHGMFDPTVQAWPGEPDCAAQKGDLVEAIRTNREQGEAILRSARGTRWQRFRWRLSAAIDVMRGKSVDYYE